MRDPIKLLIKQLNDVSKSLKVIASSEDHSAKLGNVGAYLPKLAQALDALNSKIYKTLQNSKHVATESRTLMDDVETQKYLGAFWRKPTLEELDDLATYMAGDIVGYADPTDLDLSDSGDELFNFADEKALAMEEIKEMTMVVELPFLHWKIFYVCVLSIKNDPHSDTVNLQHEVDRYLQQADGNVTCIDSMENLDI